LYEDVANRKERELLHFVFEVPYCVVYELWTGWRSDLDVASQRIRSEGIINQQVLVSDLWNSPTTRTFDQQTIGSCLFDSVKESNDHAKTNAFTSFNVEPSIKTPVGAERVSSDPIVNSRLFEFV